MGGTCCNQDKRDQVDTVIFTADLNKLFHMYKQIIIFLKNSKIIQTPSDVLAQCISNYINSYMNQLPIDPHNTGQLAIQCIHKLHPLEYQKHNVNFEWLHEACLRQNSFVRQVQIQNMQFQDCFKHYIDFLVLCRERRTQVTVPSFKADVMWHSHMQDHKKYKKDTINIFGKILNHKDDYSQQQMVILKQKTMNARVESQPNLNRRQIYVYPNSSNNNYSAYEYNRNYEMPTNMLFLSNVNNLSQLNIFHKRSSAQMDQLQIQQRHSNIVYSNNNYQLESVANQVNIQSNCGGGYSNCGGGGCSSCGGGCSSCGGGD